jgi:hypothetical protein
MELLLGKTFPSAEFACGGADDRMKIFTTDGTIRIELIRLLAQKTGLNHSAFEVLELEEIPRSQSGKIRYDVLSTTLFAAPR